MTYDPQQQRPEEQTNNSNRETLNIQQPGENANTGFDWGAVRAAREAAGRQSKVPQANDPSIGLKDVLLSVAAAPADIISGNAQLFKAGNQHLDGKASEYRSGEKKPLIDIPVSPEMLRVMQENSGNLLSRAGNAVIGGVGDLAQSASKEIKSNYSDGAKEAAAMDFITFERDKNKNVTGIKAGAGLFDKDAWMINAIPSISQMFLTASGAKLGANAVERMAEKGAYNRLIKVLPEEAARATAKETAQMAKRRAQVTGFVGVSTGTAQGQGGIDMREETNSIPFDQLLESTTFQKAFADIDSDPSNSSLTDTQKLTLARSQVAEQAANSVTADPRMLAINIAASTLGDHTLAKLLTKKMATKSVISSAATGTFAEGSTEFAQGASQRYVQNQQLINTAGQKIDPMKDVFETGANNAIVGGGIGMGAGTIGGIRGRRSAAETTPETPVDIEGSPVSENIDPSLQPEVTPQAENQTSPEVAVQQKSVSENGVPNSLIDDFRDTPAYLRQDPRVQGFADDSDVQRSLAEPEAQPTAQDLIQQQMESGEQGFTPDELAILEQADQIRAQRTPRLPAPGNIHPGEGFPMPGPIQGDESQAGAAPQFTAGEQARGQVYLPREPAEQQGAVRETQTYDGQTDPQAITDKNIIFAEGPVTNPDDVQSGQTPQFDGGQRKDVRRFTEAMGEQSETAITDQRQRAGGVPIDARTEAYAKGETLGELRLHHGKPFPNEKVARFTKWAKMPGAVIEPVGDGFGVRLPAKSTDSGIASTKEGHIEPESPQGELRLHHGKPFPNEKVARFTKWAKIPGAVIEPVGDGFGVRLPPEPTTANTKTAPSNEGVVVSDEQPAGELRLYGDQPFSSEKVAKYSKWGKMPGATIEPVGKGFGVRLPVPESAHQTKKSDTKIDDFGEELKGAAKHKWGQLAESLKAEHDIEEIKKQPLSKLFPHPDYAKMHENGIEPEKLALLAALRSFIPTKPGSPYKLNQWAEQVKGVRDLAGSIINSHASVDDIKTIFRSKSSLRSAADAIDLISQFKPEQMAEASKYSIRSGHYTYFDGKSYPGGKTLYELVTPGGMKTDISAGSMPELLPKAKEFIETKINSDKGDDALKQAQLTPRQAKLEIYTRRADKSVFIGYKGAMGVLPLKAGFKTPTEARAYLAENRAEIEAKLDKLRKTSREEQRKLTNEPRIGIERRNGNVTPEQFSDAFGFRGVQFGNYVEGARRQTELNDAYDSLVDMAELLNVPPKSLSLNGELGLAFGARGKGGAKAHYEPRQVVINLTKGNGAGSLAHEWFHALDNYFGTYDVHGESSGKRSSEFITDRRRPRYEFSSGKKQEIIHPVRQEVHDAFKSAVDKVTHSGMMERAALLDGGRSKAYWTTKLEMSARAFERYLLDKAQSKGITNDYLVNLRKADEHANPETYAYPTEAELNGGVRQAFDHLFQTLKTKPTDKGIAFYSRKGTDIGKGNVISDTGHTAAGDKPTQGIRQGRAQVIADVWVRNLNGAAKIKVKVVQTQAEAAAMMPSGIPKEFGIIHAIYQPELSRVIVVADNITSDRELRAKLRHEVLAHHGLASVIGDVEYDRIMRVLHQTRDSKNKEIQDVWREVDKSYRNESPEMQANEFLAHMAERSELSGLGAMWDRFVSVLINALKKTGIMNVNDISPTEIRNILRTVAGRFKKTAMYDGEQPGTREFDNTFSRSDALYSKGRKDPFKPDSYDAKQFAFEVENIAAMEHAPRHQVRLGDTPAVYQALGARNIELTMPASVVHKATDPSVRDHAVRLEDMKRLPELISDPVAVMRSATEKDALVSLVEAHDANGNPVIAAIHLNGKGAGFAEVNKIASVYGKDNRAALQKQLDNDLLYLDKEKAAKWLHATGLQLPGANTFSGSSKNILSKQDIRNSDALYSRTTNPSMDAETNRKMGFNVEQGWFDKVKTFYGTVTSKDKTELKAWLKETGRKLNTKTFDGMAPLKYAEDAAGINDARSSAYIGARMAAGAGSVTAATLEHGLPRYNKAEGIVERQSGTGKEDALMGILDGLGNHRENFFKWIAGHRSERLIKEGKENNFNADEIAYMKTLNRGNEALFDSQKKKYDAFIKSILDLQQDMGLIDPESRAQWEDAWYLPYYREAENGEVKGPWTSKGIANQSSTVRKLKGSDLTIKDPIENLFNYVAKSVDASMKNEAMRRSVVNLVDTGVLEVIESPNKMDFERIGKDVVKVFIDGQEKLVQVNDPELYRAFTMIDLERSNSTFMKAARTAKKVLTVSTTSMPDFIIRNFLRDSIHSWAINKDGFKPVIASWAGFKKALRTDDSLVDMMFAGATFGGGYSNVYDPASTAKTIRSVLRRKGYNDSQIHEFESSIVRNSKEVMDKVELGLHKYKNLSEAAENANRLATYDAAIKSGKSKAQAAFESRDLMDFSMMGASNIMINLSDMLPFFNARMQGLSKLGRGIKENPREVLKRGGMITAASLALMALNWDDKRYEELQDWDKDTYWHVWIGDQHIRFPKPFEFGAIFGTLPERFIRALGGKDTGAKFGKLVAHNFMETMAFNPIPQVAMPIAEAYVNYDFFKGGPIENMADSNLMAGARYNDQTSLLMREIGEATNMSPKMLDHIVMGYTGSLGGYVMGATNLLMRNLKDYGETPAMRLDELPVIKSFFRGSDPAKSTQFTEDFYRMMTEANQINSTINSFRKQGRGDDANELIEDNRGKLSQRQGLTATQKQVKALNAQIEMMRRDRILTADQKREKIDRLMATRNKLVQQAVERVNPYFNK
ncbi:LPD5 domain-containing protein [Yersinia rochesterensis]|uniref:LPD38 domain-containing protein n=1 Tax=Yersinia TaxID=629 RepID=UPI00223F3A87|nr:MULTISPECIES: LPD38 domain-containing protein [Yersinia]MDA5543330.1 LPD5 domain-containing protein [Yersinia rochesterensis]UZM73565.1 LPD5 domain-containing protein [Yersinia sp. SCPM-O-B-9106 (C-191)]